MNSDNHKHSLDDIEWILLSHKRNVLCDYNIIAICEQLKETIIENESLKLDVMRLEGEKTDKASWDEYAHSTNR